jgi:hypothetical protein
LKNATFIISVIFSGAFLVKTSLAQLPVKDAIATDSVDIFSEIGTNAGKSATIAMVSSLILPGFGHHYLERNRSALAYFTAEAVAIFGFFVCDYYSKKIALDAAGYAWIHAGAQGPIAGADDYYWKQVGKYMDVQDFNSSIDLDRLDPKGKFNQNQYWRWDGESSKDRFNSILSTSRVFHMVSSFCIGALVLDRIIAFIDIRSVTRNYGTKQTGLPAHRITVQPGFSITPASINLLLAASF